MDKAYDHTKTEEKIYKMWEENGYFKPEIHPDGKPYSIILPPPNANADLHVGHAMYVIEDIMIRYHRMKECKALWLPGADHAGFETQYVFEKHLSKEGKSRFDYPRDLLYQMIWEFVHKNRGTMENQLRRLGFSLDWSRNTFTLDPKVIEIVYKTFQKLYDDGLVYRGLRLVNYCTKCGTGFSDLEVNYIEKNDPLYYIKYGPFTIATVRPETKFRDTALAVNPKDKRYKKYIGQKLEIQGLLGPIQMTVIPDEDVDPKFGTGIMKVTPAHDPHDFELGKKFNLPVTPIIDFKGRMDFSWFFNKNDIDPKYIERAKKYHGKKVAEARVLMVEDLKGDGLLVKVDENYTHRIGVCYKSGTVIEPLPMKQWFIKIRPLADRAVQSIKKGDIEFQPKRFKKIAIQWLTNFKDWNISRQIVWGIRIPVWYSIKENPNLEVTFIDKRSGAKRSGKISTFLGQSLESIKPLPTTTLTTVESITVGTSESYSIEEIQNSLQELRAPEDAKFVVSEIAPGKAYLQETDTFDTWFSSGQWPTATLKANKSDDFKTFYPTSVMETGYDILPWWVCRMIMLGLYVNSEVPFKTVYLHGLVRDAKGQKMSKSKGNVMNPLVMVDKYGADALRMALVYGAAVGNDLALSEDKIRGMRNFSNKIWNIARFIEMKRIQNTEFKMQNLTLKTLRKFAEKEKDLKLWELIINNMEELVEKTTEHLDKYKFNLAAETLYNFTWHSFADKYIEAIKEDYENFNESSFLILNSCFLILLKLLHPFMPFVTEEIYQTLYKGEKPLIIASWPE